MGFFREKHKVFFRHESHEELQRDSPSMNHMENYSGNLWACATWRTTEGIFRHYLHDKQQRKPLDVNPWQTEWNLQIWIKTTEKFFCHKSYKKNYKGILHVWTISGTNLGELTTSLRSILCILLSAQLIGRRPAMLSCTDDVLYRNFNSQSPLLWKKMLFLRK